MSDMTTPQITPEPSPEHTMRPGALATVLASARTLLDARTARGVVIGVGVAGCIGAMATGSTFSSFGNVFSSFSASATPSASLLEQASQQLTQDQQAAKLRCAQGAQGTLGGAIAAAATAHQTIAAATPNTDQLFAPSTSCFASLSSIFDLSVTIPSLASIMDAAQSAVLAYAQKKVCTAINNATSMVTAPINQAIGQVNNLQGYTDINGMVSGQMAAIDSTILGATHPPVAEGTYTVQPWSPTSTNFGPPTGGVGTTGGSTVGGPTSTLPIGSGGGGTSTNAAQVAQLNNEIAAQLVVVNTDTNAVASANAAASSCIARNPTLCGSQLAAANKARAKLNNDQATLQSLQSQLAALMAGAGASGGYGGYGAPVAAAAQQRAEAAAAPGAEPPEGCDLLCKAGNLFK